MKTNFLPKSSYRRRSRSGRREALIIAVIFIVGAGTFSIFGGEIAQALAPVWRTHNLLGRAMSNLTGSLRSQDALLAENRSLSSKLADDEELIVSLRTVAASRDDLLAAFGRQAVTSTPVSVLVHPPETPYDVLVIDAGADLGLYAGQTAVTPGGAAIGTVSAVLARTADVRLYSSSGERTDAVLERGGLPVMLVGRGGGNLSFTLPRDTAVAVGDRVVSADLAARLVGVVGGIEEAPTDSFKTVFVRSPVNPSTVRFVSILK